MRYWGPVAATYQWFMVYIIHFIYLSSFYRGFFPKGQGEVTLEVKPLMKALKAADITDFGELVSVHGIAYVAGALPIKVNLIFDKEKIEDTVNL